MKPFILALFLVVSTNVFASVYEIGEVIPDMCWKDADAKDVCLSDSAGKVNVLLYNTGWCPECKEEMAELVPRLGELKGQPVQFLSLSAAGFTSAPPDADFLKKWKETYSIPFPVLASPKDAGKKFFEPPYAIPATVVLDKMGKLVFKEQGATVDTIYEVIKDTLQR